MKKVFIRRVLCAATLLLMCAHSVAHHNPPPLDDPIPGAIPTGPHVVELETVVAGLAFPIDAESPPNSGDRIFVTERAGIVRIIQDGVLLSQPLLDISATTPSVGSSALSSVVFHPGFGRPGHYGERTLYTLSQEAPGSGVADFGDPVDVFHQSVIYEWQVRGDNPDLVDIGTRREVLRIDESSSVHNANDMAFGADGYLYIAKGDDDLNAAGVLDGTTIHGAVLRIGVDFTDDGYWVPSSNPFVSDGSGRLAVIYAYGFRNPWRLSFDPLFGDLLVADIGEDDIEEINRVQAGGFYGWNYLEGSFAFLDFNGVTDDLSDLPPGLQHELPIAQYDHTEGDRSITGGYVYQGSAAPSLSGHYVFGDWISGRLFSMAPGTLAITEITIDPAGAPLSPGIISFAEDPAGELLIVVTDAGTGTGRLLKVAGGQGPFADTDGDGIGDGIDNCTIHPNPLQIDSNGDAIGNVCDADIAGAGGPGADDCTVAFFDLGQMKAVFFSNNADADLVNASGGDPDGEVNFFDLARMKDLYFAPPGPSAAGCN